MRGANPFIAHVKLAQGQGRGGVFAKTSFICSGDPGRDRLEGLARVKQALSYPSAGRTITGHLAGKLLAEKFPANDVAY